MTKIAIVGATGPTGIHLAAELRKSAAAVCVVGRGMDKLARTPASLISLTQSERRCVDLGIKPNTKLPSVEARQGEQQRCR